MSRRTDDAGRPIGYGHPMADQRAFNKAFEFWLEEAGKGRGHFGLDRSAQATRLAPSRPFLTKLRDAWRAAVRAWRWGR